MGNIKDMVDRMEARKEASKATSEYTDTKTVAIPNKYLRRLFGHRDTFVDVYDIIETFDVRDGALQHLLKKVLCTGERGHKDTLEDLEDIVASAQKALTNHLKRIAVKDCLA